MPIFPVKYEFPETAKFELNDVPPIPTLLLINASPNTVNVFVGFVVPIPTFPIVL